MFIINFKAKKSFKEFLKLSKICDRVAKKSKKNIILAVPTSMIFPISKAVSIPVIAQHIDAKDYGPFTGATIAKHVKQAGAFGTLINHSEKRIHNIKETIEAAKKAKLVTIVSCKTSMEAKKIANYKPDYIAYEPSELIGTKISVSEAKPEIVKKTIKAVGKKSKVLIGAGIHTKTDIKHGLDLGAKGFLVCSIIINAKNPKHQIENLISNL